MKILYEVRITFEDNTRINFTGAGIVECVAGEEHVIRHRHMKLVTELSSVFKRYIHENEKEPKDV